jgi:hypothetical protein
MPEVNMNPSQLKRLKEFQASGDYPGAYNYLAGIVENTSGADPRISSWLNMASKINSNDGSFWSNFVRNATYEAGHDIGKPIDAQGFQNASDILAKL